MSALPSVTGLHSSVHVGTFSGLHNRCDPRFTTLHHQCFHVFCLNRVQSQQLCGSRNSSSAFGKPAVSRTAATSPHSFKANAGVTPWIHAAAYRRGKTLVVCASLVSDHLAILARGSRQIGVGKIPGARHYSAASVTALHNLRQHLGTHPGADVCCTTVS